MNKGGDPLNCVMAVPSDRVTAELNSLAECSICYDKYKDPRTLPCIHSFCLQCLKHLTQSKKPGDRVRCPLCNQTFAIPAGGVGKLPGNPVVSRIVEMRSGFRFQLAAGQDSPDRTRLKRNVARVSCLLADGIQCAQMTETTTTGVLQNHKTVTDAIVQKVSDLNRLLAELRGLTEKRVEALTNERDEMNRHLAILSSYHTYCRDLAEKGEEAQVNREVADLDKRLEEMEEIHLGRVDHGSRVQAKLLNEMVMDSVMSSCLLNSTPGSADGNLLKRKHSTDAFDGNAALGLDSQRVRPEGSQTPGSPAPFRLDSSIDWEAIADVESLNSSNPDSPDYDDLSNAPEYPDSFDVTDLGEEYEPVDSSDNEE